MIYLLFASVLICLAALPAWMVFQNLALFHRATCARSGPLPEISVLIPARNEQEVIGQTLRSICGNLDVRFEILVMDDHSSDATAEVVRGISLRDPRVQLITAPELPAGWNGKQHACWQLSRLAQYDRLLFLDADVRLTPDALRRLSFEYERVGVDLLSGFPRQLTGSWAEQMLIPMMYFVLLGYLPLARMRASTRPEFGAGCGQMFFTTRAAYLAAGGHGAFPNSRHDGLQLPRSYRRANLKTDLIDASDLATVRMYSGWSSVINGLMKNATEGLANAKLIGLFSLLLLGASVLPVLSLGHAWYHAWPQPAQVLLLLACVLSFIPRGLIAIRLEQSWLGVVLHPLAVAIFVTVQWIAFARACCGWEQVTWKGRS